MRSSPRCHRLAALALTAVFVCSVHGAAVAQETDPAYLKDVSSVKQLQRDLNAGGERHLRRNIRRAKERMKAKVLGLKAAQHSRPAFPNEPGAPDLSIHRRLSEAAQSMPGAVINAIPGNVRHNDPSNDTPATSAAQSEVSLAMLGQYGISSWNDGEGFNRPNTGRGQGLAYTTDGGTTWTDIDSLPIVPGITDWVSDPVVAVNEKTGEFWFCALTEDGFNGLAGVSVISVTFPGGVFTWGTPHVAQNLSTASHFLDKEWMVADSSSGNLYLTFTHFIVGGSTIGFQRSVDGGATWSAEQTISTSSGDIQASRPAVAGDGTLYITWKQIGPVDVDFVRVRRSTNQGVSFDPQNAGISYYDNFGSGAPGFNRNRNVVEPCPVVDRSFGPHRGRLYLVVHESLNYYDDPVGGGGNKSEPTLSLNNEVNNNFFSRAVPFTPGQNLRGGMRPASDLDYWSFSATQGTSYIFWADSLSANNGGVLYTVRMFCGADTVSRLAYAGDVDAPGAGQGIFLWTAPTTGTYYFRVAHISGGLATSNGYRVRTGVAAHGAEIGRDQRDIILHYSDNGGTTWSSAKRINDEAAFYDDFLPEVGVTVDGHVYAAWYDWRDAASNCAGSSHTYVSRSLDGGDTWAANQRVTTAPTAWTFAATNIQPNQGDYIGLYAGGLLALGWGDARSGETDVNTWGTTVNPDFVAGCVQDGAVAANQTNNIDLPLDNRNVVYGNTYSVAVTNDRGWAMTFPSTFALGAGASGNVPATIDVPNGATGSVEVCYTVGLNGAVLHQCCSTFDIAVAGVGDVASVELAIGAVSPNPARRKLSVAFSLPRMSPARVDLIDVNGRRVASRDAGTLGAGRHTVSFDREIAALPAGVYAIRLVQGGRAVTRKISIVR
jgi:hypothetical protein